MGSSRGLQWLSLVGIIWLQTINGTNSNFAAYSSQLKTLLSLSELQLNNLAFASDAGKLFGFIAGLAAVYLPLWLVLLTGSLLGLTGYGLQYLFLTHYISSLSYAHIFALTVLAGNSICWINTVCYVVTIRNFSSVRHVAVGLSTSYLGLSAKVYTDAVNALFPSSPVERAKGYLLLNAVLPLLVCLVAAPLVRELNVTASDGREELRGGFGAMFTITIATGVYSVVSSLSSAEMPSKTGGALFTAALLLAPLVVPATVTLREAIGRRKMCMINREKKVYNITSVITHHGSDHDNHSDVTIESSSSTVRMKEEVSVVEHSREEIGAKVMLRRIDFWLYFFVYLLGATIGLVYMNNLGQIAESRGLSSSASLVSLSASFGFFGRLLPSIVDHYSSRNEERRRCAMIRRGPGCIAALMAPIGGALLVVGVEKSLVALYVSTGVIGVCTGAIISITVSTTAELFGERSFGVNHNLVVANIPVGSFVFGYMAALVYHQPQPHDADGKCMGMRCFHTTFIIWASLSCLGTLIAVLLALRTRNFYHQTKNTTILP